MYSGRDNGAMSTKPITIITPTAMLSPPPGRCGAAEMGCPERRPQGDPKTCRWPARPTARRSFDGRLSERGGDRLVAGGHSHRQLRHQQRDGGGPVEPTAPRAPTAKPLSAFGWNGSRTHTTMASTTMSSAWVIGIATPENKTWEDRCETERRPVGPVTIRTDQRPPDAEPRTDDRGHDDVPPRKADLTQIDCANSGSSPQVAAVIIAACQRSTADPASVSATTSSLARKLLRASRWLREKRELVIRGLSTRCLGTAGKRRGVKSGAALGLPGAAGSAVPGPPCRRCSTLAVHGGHPPPPGRSSNDCAA